MSRPNRLAVVMDPIAGIQYAKDTSLAMLQSAQRRGYELWYLEQADLYLRDGVALSDSIQAGLKTAERIRTRFETAPRLEG